MPFGEEVTLQNPPPDNRLFAGKERDPELGLDYFGARQLRTDLGRFLAPDPMSLVPEPVGAQGLGSYTYAASNPLALVDPSGMAPITFLNFTWGTGGASFGGYAPGWYGGGMSMGSLFGFSLSFSAGGSFSLFASESSHWPSIPQVPAGLPLTPPMQRGEGLLGWATQQILLSVDSIWGVPLQAPGLGEADKPLVDRSPDATVMLAITFARPGKAVSPAAWKSVRNLGPWLGMTVRQAVRNRGGLASTVNEAGYMADWTVAQVAEAYAHGSGPVKDQAYTALKMVKQAASKAQKYGGK
jgi:RHS repeat-associated protein